MYEMRCVTSDFLARNTIVKMVGHDSEDGGDRYGRTITEAHLHRRRTIDYP